MAGVYKIQMAHIKEKVTACQIIWMIWQYSCNSHIFQYTSHLPEGNQYNLKSFVGYRTENCDK